MEQLLKKIARYRRQRELLRQNRLPNFEGTAALRLLTNREKWFRLTRLDHDLSIVQESLLTLLPARASSD